MKEHLSREQFARCFVGVATVEELQHIGGCSQCRADLDGFGKTVSSLRYAIRQHVEAQGESRWVTPLRLDAMPRVRGALVAAAVLLLGMVPLLTTNPSQGMNELRESPDATSAEALMDAINLHLSRTVPSPMEPMLSLFPSDETESVLGGNQ